MARQERQFTKRQGQDGWQHDAQGQKFTEAFRPFPGGVPNNPENLRSFEAASQSGRYARRNPYGDAVQEVTPEGPVVTHANQWAGRDAASLPDMDPAVFQPQTGPGFGFGDNSPLNRAVATYSGSYATPAPGRKGTDFGSGKRNAPPPKG